MAGGPLKDTKELRAELARMKAKYDELAQEVRAAVDAVEAGEPPKLVMRQLSQRVKFGGRKWTQDEILSAAWEWRHRFNETPGATSWNPAMVRAKGGDPEALERYLDGDWPSTATVSRHFGSWNKMIDAAQLPRNEHRKGNVTRKEGDLDGLPEWTGWELVAGYRARAGIPTQAELARRSGLAWATIRNVEQGRATNPTLRVFLALAVALDLPPAALLEFRAGAADQERSR